MERIVAISVGVMLAAGTFGQGEVNFNNRVRGSVVAPIYGVHPSDPFLRLSGNATTNGGTVDYTGIPLVSGSNFTAQVWYAPEGTADMNALLPVTSSGVFSGGTKPFRTEPEFAGFIQPSPFVTLEGIPFGSRAVLQVRVWENRGGIITSWAAALEDPIAARGHSELFTTGILDPPPGIPATMYGLTSFNLQIPEPSVMGLGALGLGAVMLRRRKRQ